MTNPTPSAPRDPAPAGADCVVTIGIVGTNGQDEFHASGSMTWAQADAILRTWSALKGRPVQRKHCEVCNGE